MLTHGKLLPTEEVIKYMEAYYDRIVVKVDEYKSGRECSKCGGKGHLGVKCPYCKGTGFHNGKEDNGPCPDCTVGTGPLAKTLGRVPCELCSGQGTSSIIVPEDAEKLPTTGVITSVGWLCNFLKTPEGFVRRPPEHCLAVGDRVIFTNFSGNAYELGAAKNKVPIRILKEAEVLGILRKELKVEPEQFKELAEVGINED